MTSAEKKRACFAALTALEEAMSELAPLAASETQLIRCVDNLDTIITELNEYDYTHF